MLSCFLVEFIQFCLEGVLFGVSKVSYTSVTIFNTNTIIITYGSSFHTFYP